MTYHRLHRAFAVRVVVGFGVAVVKATASIVALAGHHHVHRFWLVVFRNLRGVVATIASAGMSTSWSRTTLKVQPVDCMAAPESRPQRGGVGCVVRCTVRPTRRRAGQVVSMP